MTKGRTKDPPRDLACLIRENIKFISGEHWIWQGSIYGNYPGLWYNGGQVRPHRVLFEVKNKVSLNKTMLKRKFICKITTCVNPDHFRIIKPYRPDRTVDQLVERARAMRRRYAEIGNQYVVAAEFGVSQMAVSHCLRSTTYRGVML